MIFFHDMLPENIFQAHALPLPPPCFPIWREKHLQMKKTDLTIIVVILIIISKTRTLLQLFLFQDHSNNIHRSIMVK